MHLALHEPGANGLGPGLLAEDGDVGIGHLEAIDPRHLETRGKRGGESAEAGSALRLPTRRGKAGRKRSLHSQTDTDRETGRQSGRQADRKAERQKGRQAIGLTT